MPSLSSQGPPAVPVPLFRHANEVPFEGQQVWPDGHSHGSSLQGTGLDLLEHARASETTASAMEWARGLMANGVMAKTKACIVPLNRPAPFPHDARAFAWTRAKSARVREHVSRSHREVCA
jgi:hypothetical protein